VRFDAQARCGRLDIQGAESDTITASTVTYRHKCAWQTAYSGAYSLNQGNASFIWAASAMTARNGRTAPTADRHLQDFDGQGRRDPHRSAGHRRFSPTLTASPALLSIGGKTYTHRPDQAGHSGHRELRRRFPPPPLTPSPDPFSRVRRPRDGGLEGIFKEIRIEALGLGNF